MRRGKLAPLNKQAAMIESKHCPKVRQLGDVETHPKTVKGFEQVLSKRLQSYSFTTAHYRDDLPQ